MNVAQHRQAIRTRLVEQKLQTVGQQRRHNRNQHGVVAGAPQRFARPAGGDPAGHRENQKDFLVSAPSQRACDLLWGRPGIAGNFARDHYIGLGWPNRDRKPWLPAMGAGSNSMSCPHKPDDWRRGTFPTRRGPQGSSAAARPSVFPVA